MSLIPCNSLHAQSGVRTNSLKLGVVDLNVVFENYEKRKLLDKEMREKEKWYQKKINEKKKELENLRDKIQLLDLGSEARMNHEDEFEKKNMELESYAKYAENSLVKKYKETFEGLYAEVLKTIETVGKRNNYDLIIKKEEANLQSKGISELQFKVGIRTVLYHSDAIDITNQVVDVLNNNYYKSGKGK